MPKNAKKRNRARRSKAGGATVPSGRKAGARQLASSLFPTAPQMRGGGLNIGAVAKATFTGTDLSYQPRIRIGVAAPHEDYPDGGIRLSGVFSNPYADALYNPGSTAGNTGAWYAATAATMPPLMLLSPTGYAISSVCAAHSAFGGASGAVGNIAQYFRRFRIRKLAMIFNTILGSTAADQLQVSYEKDAPAAFANAALNMLQTSGIGQTAERFPAWEPCRYVQLIPREKASRDDELFYTSAAGDGITLASQSPAVWNQYFQGGVYAINSSFLNTTSTTIGSYFWDFEIDLYGFSLINGTNLSLLDEKLRKDSEVLRLWADEDEKRKECETELAVLPQAQSRVCVTTTPANTPHSVLSGSSGIERSTDSKSLPSASIGATPNGAVAWFGKR